MPSANTVASHPIARLGPYWAFATCWIAIAIGLYLAGSPPTGPAVFPDEVCRLGWARLLSGTGPHYDMSQAAYCQPYYPLLLAPFQWLSNDPAAIHKGVFALNSAFAALCAPLAVRLGIRHFEMSAGAAWIAAIAILAYPSLTLYSHHAMPETILFPAVLVAMTLWCNWVDKPGWRQFAILLAMSFVLYALHRKMMVVPLALMASALIGWRLNPSPRNRIYTLLAALCLAVAFWLDDLVKKVALSAHLQAGDANAMDVLFRLSSLEFIWGAIGKAAGIIVYSTFVTGGLIWLVIGVGLDSIYRGIRTGFIALEPFAKKSAFPFGLSVLLVILTAAYFGTAERFDTWFYGRHVNSALGAALLPAIAMVVMGRAERAVLRWAAALSLVVFLILIFQLPAPPWGDFSPIHTIGAGGIIQWLHMTGDRWILLAYCAGVLAIAGVMCFARLHGAARFAALAPFLIVTTSTHVTTQPFEGVPINKAIPEAAAKLLRSAEPCHIYFDERNGGRLRGHQIFRLQYYFPNCSIELAPADHPWRPGGLVVVRRIYADCPRKSECHHLHPDLVLHETPDK